jgi:1-acyl-sn-glycerol-3-phosphate acyltransferase
MSAWRKHPFRVTGRIFWLGGALALGAACFLPHCAFRGKANRAARSRWLREVARRLLPVFGVEIQIRGELPSGGLLVCNHLSYLDIVVLAAITPAVFVSKSEVRHWPVFGWFAKVAGSIFVNRQSRGQVGQLAEEMEDVLESGLLVILFPEGTSSGGETVLPFKSSLLEPATRRDHPLWVALIQYELPAGDGDVAEEVCYWKDMTLGPHLVNLLGKKSVGARLSFARVEDRATDRKELARQLHSRVLGMK